jgi:hypothetical protein
MFDCDEELIYNEENDVKTKKTDYVLIDLYFRRN